MHRCQRLLPLVAALIALTAFLPAADPGSVPATPSSVVEVPIRDIASVEGIRDNLLVGYGIVVGLNGTGDRLQTLFTTQTLANVLQKMGVQIPSGQVQVNNVAAVFVTATLPPFARPGMRIDVMASSTGDARSLFGGTLLLTPLRGPDGQVYAEAQGPLIVGGYSAGSGTTSVQVNQPNVGTLPQGGIVERDTAIDLQSLSRLSFLLREPDFGTAQAMARAINQDFGRPLAQVVDSRRIDVVPPAAHSGEVIPDLLARIESIQVGVNPPARVVVDERTGTVVIGAIARLGPVSILHGDLAIEIASTKQVSQPTPFSQGGSTKVVQQTSVNTREAAAAQLSLAAGSTVQDLVRGLQGVGATPRDIVAILKAIQAAGALQAKLEVI